MDEPEDEKDAQLQRSSPELLADLKSSLDSFMWQTTKTGEKRIRRRVRAREMDRLVDLLEPFQELPQLLDPHLNAIVPVLSNAFLECLQSGHSKHSAPRSKLLTPVSAAICRILYTICKIRGEKVIVRFFSTETKFLEPLLSAIEADRQIYVPEDAIEEIVHSHGEKKGQAGEFEPSKEVLWTWEQRYIVLLWLSQLFLAPFDLATISSVGTENEVQAAISGFAWPPNVPGVTLRVVPLAIHYLSSSGRERDAAKVLLARIAMRRDMQDCGILHALIRWAIFRLRPSLSPEPSLYYYIGTLAFIATVLTSSLGTSDMNSFLPTIAQVIQTISSDDNPAFANIHNSPVARKSIIKTLRTIVVLILQGKDSMFHEGLIGDVIGYMLEGLADPATPVRLAASKALSIITLKLPIDMGSEVVEEVLRAFNKNVFQRQASQDVDKINDLSRVNPSEWHGLVLTLSHLIYRRSIPALQLSPIVDALRLGLAFEQRSTSGASIGTNVRDAACFGFWGLARRYSTIELQSITMSGQGNKSVIQVLANELIVSASLDPAGNIRRGSSAALQELVGRHPDAVANGISVVQVVDYHAVALRSRAMLEVACQAAQLSDYYYQALFNHLLGWRGVQDVDVSARQCAALTFGGMVWTWSLSAPSRWEVIISALNTLGHRLQRLELREVDERHGLILCLAAIISHFNGALNKETIAADLITTSTPFGVNVDYKPGEKEMSICKVINFLHRQLLTILEDFHKDMLRSSQPANLLDALSKLIIASHPVLRAGCVFSELFSQKASSRHASTQAVSPLFPPSTDGKNMVPRLEELNLNLWPLLDAAPSNNTLASGYFLQQTVTSQKAYDIECPPDQEILKIERNIIDSYLVNGPKSSFEYGSEAAMGYFLLISDEIRMEVLSEWKLNAYSGRRSGRAHGGQAYIHTLLRFPMVVGMHAVVNQDLYNIQLAQGIRQRYQNAVTDSDLEVRVTILKCLTTSPSLSTHPLEFIPIIEAALNDYTTTKRGDVGSEVRIWAVRAACTVLYLFAPRIAKFCLSADPVQLSPEDVRTLMVYGHVLRVASEKLDRVRTAAKPAIVIMSRILIQNASDTDPISELSISSKEYFLSLLSQLTQPWSGDNSSRWTTELLRGYVTSADTGSEDLVRSSRLAMVEFCKVSQQNLDMICKGLFLLLEQLVADPTELLTISVLEVMAFLFDYQVMQRCININWSRLAYVVNLAHHKTTNFRKLEAAIKLYGALIEVFPKTLERVIPLLQHRFPKIRISAAEELFLIYGVGKGIDWLAATKDQVATLKFS